VSKLSRGGKDVLTITQVNYIRELYYLEGKNFADICSLINGFPKISQDTVNKGILPREYMIG
jgi:hypothetical protein